MTFHITKHAEKRMQQRGYRPSDIEFVLQFGSEAIGGVILSKKDAQKIEREARKAIEIANRLRGLFIPLAGSKVKTVYKASLRQQRRYL
ncbi:MAG: DUF4258 domain-containing protein [Chloroflexi bacterium]|nr:DUF4258 domain-containing protein [Chloroflexota bacterium]